MFPILNMDPVNEKGKKKKTNLLVKTWDRCQILPRGGGREKSAKSPNKPSFSKSKSWHSIITKMSSLRRDRQVAPEGCFSVYVGPDRQRFMIRTESANHPLFKMLLEDAEREYGYSSEGPLLIPCDIELFCKVLAEMDRKEIVSSGGFLSGSWSPFSPSRRLGNSNMGKMCGSYGILTPSRLLKMNQI